MRTFLSFIFITLISFGLIYGDAYAKRFGGGKSFGMSRSIGSYSRGNPIAGAQTPLRNKLFGPIAGLITGGLLASLLMGNGLASGIFTWIIAAIVCLMLVKLLRMRRGYNNHINPRAQTYQAFKETANDNNSYYTTDAQATRETYHSINQNPSGFDSETFLREAKKQFIRLQAAFDQKNLADLRRFTAPDVFAEIQMQLQERGEKNNQTDVVSLDAILLDVANESENYSAYNSNVSVASVKFSGSIKEDGINAESFSEIWHFRKENSHSEWIVAGIQQM